MKILDTKIDNFSKEEMFKKISEFLDDGKFHQITTINQEIILKAQKDSKLKSILNDCSLNLADSIGIKFAFWRFGKKLECRIAGADLMKELLKTADDRKLKIYLAANKDGLSSWEETKIAILKIYPNLEIDGINLDPKNPGYKLQVADYRFIFCNFGASFQEKFLNSLKNDIIGIAVGVGGSFDYLTGKLKRAPKWMRNFGIEWLWRLILQPKRSKRIFNAVVIFPIKLIFSKE